MRKSVRALLLALLLLAAAASPASAFQNGAAAPAMLSPIFTPDPGQTAYLVKGPVASSWNTANLCAATAGRPLSPGASRFRPAATAYRSVAIQRILFRELGPRLAARPGTSNHGLGRAIDLRTPAQRRWIDERGGRFGWSKLTSDAPHEWWHLRASDRAARFGRPDPGASFRYPRLTRGSGGECQAPAVRELQRRLGLRQDGEFGKQTSKRVRDFKRSKAAVKYRKAKKLKWSTGAEVRSTEWIVLRKLGRSISEKNGGGTTVRPNAQGQDVRAVQGLLAARLRELGRPGSVCTVDGRWDLCDKRAAKKFQALVGLKVTGVVDPKTYAALRKPRGTATRLDSEGLLFLAREEGLRTTPYNDSAGHCTVGVGHLIHHGRCAAADFRRYRGFTTKDAHRLLGNDVRSRELAVSRRVRVRRRQNELNAAVSLVFNIGEGGWANSTVLRRWNAGDRRGAGDAFLLWHRGGRPFELLPRRKRERALFLRR